MLQGSEFVILRKFDQLGAYPDVGLFKQVNANRVE